MGRRKKIVEIKEIGHIETNSKQIYNIFLTISISLYSKKFN